MNHPKVSIVIVNYNQKYFARMCVEAIEASRVSFPLEIIVVDNASQDESIEYLRRMAQEGRIRLIEAGANLGYGKGNNLGVQNAQGEYIVISNPDVFVREDTLQSMVDYLEAHPEIGVLGPRLRYYNGQVQESCRRHMTFTDLVIKRTFLKHIPRFKKRLDHYLMNDFDHDQVQEVDLIVGAYYLLRKKVYEEVGGFDPRYFLFMEDYDFCRKLHQSGYQVVYYPKAEAEHYHKRLSGGSLFWLLSRKIFWIHLSSAIKYFLKWKGKSLKPKRKS